MPYYFFAHFTAVMGVCSLFFCAFKLLCAFVFFVLVSAFCIFCGFSQFCSFLYFRPYLCLIFLMLSSIFVLWINDYYGVKAFFSDRVFVPSYFLSIFCPYCAILLFSAFEHFFAYVSFYRLAFKRIFFLPFENIYNKVRKYIS